MASRAPAASTNSGTGGGVQPWQDWAVEDVGHGTPIVLVHGLGTDAGTWNRLVPLLAADHRVVTVDLPGYSLRSRVDDVPHATELADGIAALLAERDVGAAVLVGHSFGGAVSLITAQRHPRRCGGLVLVAPGGFGAELNPLIALVGTRFGPRLLRSLYTPRASRAIEGIAARVTARPPHVEGRVRIDELMETYDRLRSEHARAQFRASVQRSLALNARPDRAAFADIDRGIPVLVLWGREDRVLPSWQAKTATQLLPGSVVHLVDGAGHTPHRSHAGQVSTEIRTFADSGAVRRREQSLDTGEVNRRGS